ncbi:MAG: hypothetical protein KAI74_01735 [Kiritimatiellae bacterium]|nr:hypothetical protein [Kiritimatiellia bacterium]
MAKSRESSGNMQIITPGERRVGFVGSFLVPLIIVVVVLMVAGFFMVKTDGGKKVISDRLARYLEMDVELDVTRIGWPYALVMEGVSAREEESSTPVVTAESVRLSFDLKFRMHVVVDGAELTLVQNDEEEWAPDVFARLGDVPGENITQLAETLDLFDKRVVIDVANSDIKWVDQDGSESSVVSGLDFNTSPIKIREHYMRHFYLAVESGLVNENQFSGIEKEWIASGTKPYLPLHDLTDEENEKWEVVK